MDDADIEHALIRGSDCSRVRLPNSNCNHIPERGSRCRCRSAGTNGQRSNEPDRMRYTTAARARTLVGPGVSHPILRPNSIQRMGERRAAARAIGRARRRLYHVLFSYRPSCRAASNELDEALRARAPCFDNGDWFARASRPDRSGLLHVSV